MYWDYEYGFNPTTVNINPGELVTFSNGDIYGLDVRITVGSTLSFWLEQFKSQSVPFNFAGIYGVESDWGDSATVIVGTLPSVTITNPVDYATFQAPATVLIQADASDPDGISDVEFYIDDYINGEVLLKDDDMEPYSATAVNLPEGSYYLTAVAYDNQGLYNWHSVFITVTPPPPVIALSNPRIENEQFIFDASGLTVGRYHVLEYRNDLANGAWTPVGTNYTDSASVSFTNAVAAGDRFYRVIELGD